MSDDRYPPMSRASDMEREWFEALFGKDAVQFAIDEQARKRAAFEANAPTIAVKKMTGYMPITQQQIREADEFRQAMIDNKARRDAMTQAERDVEDAQWEARRAAEKLERICPHCGCDPDEHGGD